MKSEESVADTPSDITDERPLLLVVEDNSDIRLIFHKEISPAP